MLLTQQVGNIFKVKPWPQYPDIFAYFKLCDGPFIINCGESGTAKFIGLHFIGLGTTFFGNYKDKVFSLDIMDKEYEIVEEVPDDLIP